MLIEPNKLKIIKGGNDIIKFMKIGSIISFFIGFLDGFMRPLKCRWTKNNYLK